MAMGLMPFDRGSHGFVPLFGKGETTFGVVERETKRKTTINPHGFVSSQPLGQPASGSRRRGPSLGSFSSQEKFADPAGSKKAKNSVNSPRHLPLRKVTLSWRTARTRSATPRCLGFWR